jgi:hypothetical protein
MQKTISRSEVVVLLLTKPEALTLHKILMAQLEEPNILIAINHAENIQRQLSVELSNLQATK